jgi:hypothetical protein
MRKRAWLFIATSRRHPTVFIGSSSDPQARSRSLSLHLEEVIPVVPSAARHVLSQLRHPYFDVQAASADLARAYQSVSRYHHVDPSISPEVAKARRLRTMAE